MNTYYITETQNGNSVRQAESITCKNISSAKRQATKAQYYFGTVLKIYASSGHNGYGEGLISTKHTGFANKWVDEL